MSRKTLTDFEKGLRQPYERTLRDIRETLEKAGILFIDPNGGGGPGVRLRDNDGGS